MSSYQASLNNSFNKLLTHKQVTIEYGGVNTSLNYTSIDGGFCITAIVLFYTEEKYYEARIFDTRIDQEKIYRSKDRSICVSFVVLEMNNTISDIEAEPDFSEF